MQSLYKGRAVSNAVGVKRWAIIFSLLIPAILALYDAAFSVFSSRVDWMLTTGEVGILLSGIGGFVTTVLTVISTPKLGLNKRDGQGMLDDPEMLRRRPGESDL